MFSLRYWFLGIAIVLSATCAISEADDIKPRRIIRSYRRTKKTAPADMAFEDLLQYFLDGVGPKPIKNEFLQRLKKFNDEELKNAFMEFAKQRSWISQYVLDFYLNEIISRGGPDWARFLSEHISTLAERSRSIKEKLDVLRKQSMEYFLATVRAREAEGERDTEDKPDTIQEQLHNDPNYKSMGEESSKLDESHELVRHNLELLTALRQIQSKDNPLMIVVARRWHGGSSHYRDGVFVSDRQGVSCTLADLPTYWVSLINVDVEHVPLSIQIGGASQSGRQVRWRFEVCDSNGDPVALRKLGGWYRGMSQREPLEYGESWSTELDMQKFIHIDDPGEYTVQILYHDSEKILFSDDLEGLVVHKSAPFKLSVSPVTLWLDDSDRVKIKKLISGLPKSGTVKIHIGPWKSDRYDKSSDFIPEDSPAAQLIRMGWDAVPDLIHTALSKETPAVQRAWIFGLLYGITDRNDPGVDIFRREPDSESIGTTILGTHYEYRGPGGHGSGGSQWKKREIDVQAQLKFAERWRPWIEKGRIQIHSKLKLTSARAASPGS